MPFCTQCGNRLDDEDKFCTKCGKMLRASATAETPVEKIHLPKEFTDYGPKSRSLKPDRSRASGNVEQPIIAWFFSIILILGGLASLMVASRVGGVLIMVSGFLIFPLIYKYLEENHNISLKNNHKIISASILFLVGAVFLLPFNTLIAPDSPHSIIIESGLNETPVSTNQSEESTQSQNPLKATSTSEDGPIKVNMFSNTREEEHIKFYFLLEDKDGLNTAWDGHVKLEIFDDIKTILFSSEFDVKKSDFVDSPYQPNGSDLGKAFEWTVLFNDIKKGVSSLGLGRAVLTFTTTADVEMIVENKTVQIPIYSEEELTQMSEEQYARASENTTFVVEDETLKLELLRFGRFIDYSSNYKSNNLFRVDIDVTAKISGVYVNSTNSKLLDTTSNQFEVSNKSRFPAQEFEENTKTSVYLIFKDVPENTTVSKIIIDEFVFDLDDKRESPDEGSIEEEYTNSKTTIKQTIAKGDFEVTVISVGFYDYLHETGATTEYFRIDIVAKNIGTESKYFSPSSIVVVDSQDLQYKRNKEFSTLDIFIEVLPGTETDGYLLIGKVPKPDSNLKFQFELGHDTDYNPYLFEFNLTL